MLYHIKVEANYEADDGNVKRKAHEYLTDVELFAQAELNGLKVHILDEEEADVVAIKRSNINEVDRTAKDGERYYLITVIDIYTDEITGKDKEMKYLILLPAPDMDNAKKRADEIISQGYDMHLKKIEESRIEAII